MERERSEQANGRKTERRRWDEEGTIGAVVLYVETLIGVTCSETSYRRVALIFRGSYMPVVGERVGGGSGGGWRASMCGGWYTLDAARLMPRTHVVFHDGNQPAAPRARMLRVR